MKGPSAHRGATAKDTGFRRFIYSGSKLQLVPMGVEPGGAIRLGEKRPCC